MASIEYLAGFFDGDGCILTGGPPTYRPKIVVAQRILDPLFEFDARWGGVIHQVDKAMFQWHIARTTTVITALEEMLPHLIVKREQAEMMLAVLDYFKPLIEDRRRSATIDRRAVLREMSEHLKVLKRPWLQ